MGCALSPSSLCADLIRASTSLTAVAEETWVAGSSPAMGLGWDVEKVAGAMAGGG
jgi:hypothetical protein